MTLNRMIVLPVALALVVWGTATVRGGCSDEDFLKADETYQAALKAEPASKKIELLEQSFAVCPSHGSFAQGYLMLGKLYYDAGDKPKALQWLREAQRFSGTMLETSEADVAQTNLLLANLYKDGGNNEKALVHFNIYRALAKQRDTGLERVLLKDADRFLSLMYSPRVVAETLGVDKSIAPEHWPKINRIEVYFDFGRAALDDEARRRLDAVGKALQNSDLRECTIVVEGHTDEAGGAEFNCELGARRARAVAEYLIGHWYSELRICPVSYGKTDPVIAREGHDRKYWDQIDRFNRRVVIWNSGAQKRVLKDIVVEHESRSPCRQ
ncbi:MAG: OmpA family protein [Desulfomonile sp.]|nr:OmpA family protein [Desulfomonile sp.]